MISIIVAYDDNKTIGYKGKLPWVNKEDLAYFKSKTKQHTCVMGRVTYESILKTLGKPLPNRKNVVVSRQKLNDTHIEVIQDFEGYLKQHQETEEEIFVIGGHLIYKMALPYAKRLYITHIKGVHKGDTFFPPIDFTEFERIVYNPCETLAFTIYERV